MKLTVQEELDNDPQMQRTFAALKPRLADFLLYPVTEAELEAFLVSLLWHTRPSEHAEWIERWEGETEFRTEEPLRMYDADKLMESDRALLAQEEMEIFKHAHQALIPCLQQLCPNLSTRQLSHRLLGWMYMHIGYRKLTQLLRHRLYPYLLDNHKLGTSLGSALMKRWADLEPDNVRDLLCDQPEALLKQPEGILTELINHDEDEIRELSIRAAGSMQKGHQDRKSHRRGQG